MTVLQDIEKLIARLGPEPVCDSCIAETLGLLPQDHADQIARELAGLNGFERGREICSLCGETAQTTRHR